MRRYSSRQGLTFGEGDKGVRRLQLVIIIILALALTVALVMLIPNLSVKPEVIGSCTSQIKDEWRSASNDANKLSSTLSAPTNNQPLASLRSHVTVIHALNDVYRQAGGRHPIEELVFQTLIGSIDRYLDALTQGGSTSSNEFNIQIQDGLTQLQQQIDAM